MQVRVRGGGASAVGCWRGGAAVGAGAHVLLAARAPVVLARRAERVLVEHEAVAVQREVVGREDLPPLVGSTNPTTQTRVGSTGSTAARKTRIGPGRAI